ncbi:MAG TPA: AAC(3) family N-acetyltransferase [Dehalococcoidia bacterium]
MIGIDEETLADDLRSLGVPRGGVLLVHMSLREVGWVDGGPMAVIQAFRKALGPEGTLVMPAATGARRDEPFDPRFTPTRGMGAVAERFWREPGALRSNHPTSSMAAEGPRAEEIVREHPLNEPAGPHSPVGKVYDLDGWVLLLGVDQTANVTVHLGEHLGGAPYRVKQWATVWQGDKTAHRTLEVIEHCHRGFARVEEPLRDRAPVYEGLVGQARAVLVRSRDVAETAAELVRENPTVFLCARGSGCVECDEAWASIR